MELKVCIFQFDIQWLDLKKNISLIKNKVESINDDFDLIVLPEMFLSGFCMDPSLAAIKEDSVEIRDLIEISKMNNIAIIGSVAIEEEGKYYNRVLLISDEGIIGRYDKQYLFSPSGENEAFGSKYDSNLIDFKGWKILPQVCYDLRFPENIRSLPSPDLLIYMANWPTPRIHHWDTLLKARAIENLCLTIGCNRTGTDDNNWEYPGHSVLLKADGSLTGAVVESESNVFTINKKETEEYRAKYRFLDDKKTFA